MLEAIILAGGLGTRLATTVPHLPKALAPIQGIPFLHLLLEQLARTELLSKVVMALGHKAPAIESYLRSQRFPFSIEFSVESNPLGTGGALLFALPKTLSNTLLVLNGDSFFDLNFDVFHTFHLTKKSALTIACQHVENKSRYGSMQFDAAQRIGRFTEKSTVSESGWISAGIYLIQRELLTPFLPSSYSLEYDLFPQFLEKGAFAYLHSGTFIDIGMPHSYQQAQELLNPWISLCKNAY